LPEGQPFITEITENYVRYRFSRQASLDEQKVVGSESVAGSRLVRAWQQLHPVLWRAWGRKVMRIALRQRDQPFSLVRE
jgi:hypothetical protein